MIFFILFEAIKSAFSTPSRRIWSKYDLSSNNFFISKEIEPILSTKTWDNFSLNSEKFLPAKLSIDFSIEELVNKIEPISNEIKKLLEDKKFLDEILLDGVEKANMIASKKIERIKEIVGF